MSEELVKARAKRIAGACERLVDAAERRSDTVPDGHLTHREDEALTVLLSHMGLSVERARFVRLRV